MNARYNPEILVVTDGSNGGYYWKDGKAVHYATKKIKAVDTNGAGDAFHGVISYGHIGTDIITLCSMLRIPVCMHNVDEKDIYRPASWNAFGMDKEGQDYRACQAYGLMYKNIRN